jgi:hypothetical protein
MAIRRYRVVKSLPWIEGGRPLPGFRWEGGRAVVYEPGQTMQVDDRELVGIYNHLEGLDAAGRAALDAVRTKAEAPAKRTAVADLHPRTVQWLTRALDEKLRAKGHLRELCLRLLARGDDPTNDDLAAALEESPDEPLPRELLEYLVAVLRGRVQRKSGPKAPARSTEEDILIHHFYHFLIEEFTRNKRRCPYEHRRPHRAAAEYISKALGPGYSVRTIQRIVAPRPWTNDGKGIKKA